jgi:hypothetical protein
MSTTFQEFLHKKAQTHQAEVNAAKSVVDEWWTSIERLFAQIRQWMKQSDPDGLIEIKEGVEEIREPGLGVYRAPRLDLRAFGKWIGVIPKARRTVGRAKPPQKSAPERAEGRVDITDELRRYVLYRFKQDGRDVWLIDGLETGREGAASEPAPLDQEAFEKAMMSYLQ